MLTPSEPLYLIVAMGVEKLVEAMMSLQQLSFVLSAAFNGVGLAYSSST